MAVTGTLALSRRTSGMASRTPTTTAAKSASAAATGTLGTRQFGRQPTGGTRRGPGRFG